MTDVSCARVLVTEAVTTFTLLMHGPRLVSLPVADWLAQTQLNSTTSPTAPTAPCTASTASTAPIDAPNAPGLPDYRTAHRSSSSELGELESEQREIELRVASLSADSRGGRRRVVGPPQGKSIIACAIGLCICASTTRVSTPLTSHPVALSPLALRPSPLAARPSRPLGTGSAQRSLGSLGCCCARQRRGRGPCGSPGASEC